MVDEVEQLAPEGLLTKLMEEEVKQNMRGGEEDSFERADLARDARLEIERLRDELAKWRSLFDKGAILP